MKHIVALSGGKDSTAMALWLVQNEPRDYEFICTPTGDELPEMIEYWRMYMDAEAEEIERGHTYRSPGRDSQPAALAELRVKFENGYVPKDTRERGIMCRVCSL